MAAWTNWTPGGSVFDVGEEKKETEIQMQMQMHVCGLNVWDAYIHAQQLELQDDDIKSKRLELENC